MHVRGATWLGSGGAEDYIFSFLRTDPLVRNKGRQPTHWGKTMVGLGSLRRPQDWTVKKSGPGRRQGQPQGTEWGSPEGVWHVATGFHGIELWGSESRSQDPGYLMAMGLQSQGLLLEENPSWRDPLWKLLIKLLPQSQASPVLLSWLLTHCQDLQSQQAD